MAIQRGEDGDRFSKFESLGDAAPFVVRIHEIIEHIQLFEDFGRADVLSLARHMACYRAPAGSEIIREGEQGDFMLLLLEGNIEIVKIGGNGLPQRIGLAGPGKTLGEMSLVDGEPRFASCIAIEAVTFAVLDRAGLGHILVHEPHLGIKILMELLLLLNQRLRSVSGRLMQTLAGSVATNPQETAR